MFAVIREPEGFRERLLGLFAGLNDVEVAKRLGVTQPTVSRWRRQQRTPDALSLARICSEFDCSADWLLGVVRSNEVEEGVDRGTAGESALHARILRFRTEVEEALSRLVESRRAAYEAPGDSLATEVAEGPTRQGGGGAG